MTLLDKALAEHYRDGVKDGMKITLELMLGTPSSGGVPYIGPVPVELQEWAENALSRIEQA